MLKDFIVFIWTQYQYKIKALDLDGGKEFGISKLQDLSKEHRFLVRMTTPYTSSINSISERGIRIIAECLKCIFEYSRAPKDLWPELMISQIHTINRTATSALNGRTPYEVFYLDILYWLQTNPPPSGSAIYIPDVSYLRILGGKVITYINKESARRVQSEKFALRGTEGILVGYKGNRIYRCKLDDRPDIVRVSSIRFEEGSEDFVNSNPLEVFSIPDYLDDSIDYILSFETSKLLQAMEHSTTDKAEKSPENRYSVESDSDEGSASDTIVVDYVLVPDSLI